MLKGTCLSAVYFALHPEEDVPAEALEIEDMQINLPKANNNGGALPGPTVLAYVTMAKTIRQQHARMAVDLGNEIGQPRLSELISHFLYDQLNPDSDLPGLEIPYTECPMFNERISIFYSAAATYYTPSDASGIGRMHREHLRATPLWWHTAPQFDCTFVNCDADVDGIHGLGIVRIYLFFSFKFWNMHYPCALVRWFRRTSDEPDEDTGMYIVCPETKNHSPVLSVIHLDTIVRAAHLIGVYGDKPVPRGLTEHQALDAFRFFYVNRFADHHTFETVF
ncbi:hypothetical protein A0H81_05422 [Grifola frondosa]|uniref:Uncharacterized protein n=1 Tax=Grifola frondosa TaxID=5627 RepID=A0A1C7MBS7_GRIFR|nr:hypothetical protein A0H81_05422 [Grifola frondosa]